MTRRGEGILPSAPHARPTGVSLKTVLEHCIGLDSGAGHLGFIGFDTHYGQWPRLPLCGFNSIGERRVRLHEVLSAQEINGKPLRLPDIHRYAVTSSVVCGYSGARSVYAFIERRIIQSCGG